MRTGNYTNYLLVIGFVILTVLYLRSPSNSSPQPCEHSETVRGRADRLTMTDTKVERMPIGFDSKSLDLETALLKHDVVPPYKPSHLPIIWIGGMPRSGTTLMRAMLDAHPDVRCGEETRVLPRILGMRAQWKRNEKENKRLTEAGLDDSVLNAAITSFITQIIVRHGKSAPRLCNKDPFTLKSVDYLQTIFPKSRFILMLRDARATVHSIISRKVTITGFDLKNPRQCLQKWNAAITTMYDQCQKAGPQVCMPVYYEQLVLQPNKTAHAILKFLDIPWDERVLNHERYIGGDISLSMVERSTDQIIKPINTDALAKWVGFYPKDVIQDMDNIAPMLKQLGYDPFANPPNYGKAEELVIKKTEDVHKNPEKWQRKVDRIMHKTSVNVTTDKPIADFEGHKAR